jgi:hypothetical protein
MSISCRHNDTSQSIHECDESYSFQNRFQFDFNDSDLISDHLVVHFDSVEYSSGLVNVEKSASAAAKASKVPPFHLRPTALRRPLISLGSQVFPVRIALVYDCDWNKAVPSRATSRARNVPGEVGDYHSEGGY